MSKTKPTQPSPETTDTILPEGWDFPRLSDLLVSPKTQIVDGPFGSDLKASEYRESGIPIIRLQNVGRHIFDPKNLRFISPQKADELRRHDFRPNDIVVTKLGAPLGKACIVPEGFGPGIIVADIVRVRVECEALDRKYLSMAINSESVATQLIAETKGTTRPRVNLGHIRDLRVPLAPLAEQARIVAKVEELLERVNAARARLAKVPDILKRFRQSVLAAACDASLTEEWRERNGHQRWREASAAQILGEPMANGRSVPDGSGFPVLRLTAIRNGRVDLEARKLGAWSHSEAARFVVAKGDFLVARGNGSLSLVGRGALVELEPDPVAFPDTLIRLRPDPEKVSPSFLRIAWDSPKVRSQIERAAHTTAGIHKVSQADISAILLPIPPLTEQAEIVRRVEALFKLADTIEKRVAAATARAEKLPQAILARAFRGELVPTEAELARRENRSYEPTSELLARIGSARNPAPKTPRSKRQHSGTR